MCESLRRPFALDLEVKRLDVLYTQNLTAPVTNALAIGLFLFAGWGKVSTSLLLAWSLFVAATTVCRVFLTWRWRRKRTEIDSTGELQKWHYILVTGLFLVGVSYGVLGWVSTTALGPAEQAYLWMLLVGVCSGSVANYAASIRCSLAILLPSVVLWFAAASTMAGSEYRIVMVFLVVYTILHIRLARNAFSYANDSIRLNSELHDKEQRLRLERDASGGLGWTWELATDRFLYEGDLRLLFGREDIDFRGSKRDYVQLIHADDRSAFEAALLAGLETKTLDTEHRVIWPDGAIHHILVRGRTESNALGSPLRMVGIAWDITAKKAQDELRHERDLLEASNRTKLIFLANASHEIRTPLSAINGFAEMILDHRDLLPEVREDLKVILRNGKYLASVVNDLLDLSKSENDQAYMQTVSMSPVQEIQDALLVVQGSADRKRLEIELIYQTPMPASIQSDPTRFRQILINLLSNAIKFTEQGRITVTVACVLGSENVLRILVSDTGMGLSPEILEHLFEPFSRGRSEAVQKTSGSGLGLALSRNLARLMGGDIRPVLPSLASGCTFEFTLNMGSLAGVAFGPVDATVRPAEKDPAAPALVPRLGGRRILVVEDDADLRELMERYLQREGAIVSSAVNGLEAMQAVQNGVYHVVLMDIKMPVMDGYQATTKLREMGFRNRIVALTAHASTVDRQMCYQAGCDSYLSKPIDPHHLLSILTGVPGTPELRVVE